MKRGMVWGKQVRLGRITENGRMLCVPMDHGVSSGPVKGLEDIHGMFYTLEKAGVTAVLAHKGVFRTLPRPLKVGTIMHMSASTSLSSRPNLKVQVATVEQAIKLGVDAISVHVNIGGEDDPDMLVKLGMVADECDEWQIPFIAMMYPRGSNIKNPQDVEAISHVARVGAELGADMVKTPMPSADPSEVARVTRRCPVPVVAAGGPKMERDEDILKLAWASIKGGCVGITFGRNIFQHRNPEAIVKALREIVLNGKTPEEVVATGILG